MDPTIVAGLVISAFAGCAAIGGCIALSKNRPPLEGVLLGLLLGPVGVLIECRHPYLSRPPVDQNAFRSLRSMMTFQESGRETRR